MKNIYTSIVLFLIFVYSYGQSASNYTFTAVQGNYISLTGVAGVTDTSIAATADEGISTAITLPFAFTFAGTAYTSIKVSPNGWMYLGSGTPAESNDNTQANAESRKPILFPLWDNLKCNVAPRYVTTGIAPHRRFKVEWMQQSWNNGVPGDVISFQVWLFETTNVVEYLYNQGAVAANTASSGGASIGIYDASSRYLTLNNSGGTPIAQSDIFTTNIATKPATGQIFRFSPPATAGLDANNYCFSTSSRTYDNLLSTTDVPGLAASSDDALSSAVALPFTFNFAGAFYSNIRVSSNGWITFTSPTPTASQNYTNNVANANIIKPALFALWDDIELTVVPKYVTSGTAPNRIFKIEFSKQKWDYAGASDAISFQIWLYEKSNNIEYIYKQGPGALRNPSATIGIYDANGKYLLLNDVSASPTTTSSSFIFTLGAKPATGQVYKFTPPPLISYPGNAFISIGTVGVTQSGATGGTYSATPPGLSFVSTSTGEVNLTGSLGGTYTITYNVGGCVSATTEMTIFPLLPQPVGTVGIASCASGNDGSITITNMNNSVRFVAADNDYIDLGSQMLSGRAAFTMGGWIKFKASDITGRMSLFGQNDAIEFGFSSSSTFELWSVATGPVTASFTPATLGNEAWHHISVTGDGARIRIYIDGVSIPVTGGVVNTTNYGSSTFTTKIGSRVFSNTTGETFTGSILKTAFYSTALSASRIESLAFGPTVYSGYEPGIIAGYNYYDGSGTTLTSIPAGFNGTFFSTPEWVDPYTYAWQRVGNNTVIATTKNITGLTPGDYRVTVALTGVSSPNAKVFTVGSAADVIASAGTGASCTTTINANWGAVGGTTSYVLDVATDAAFTSFVSGYNGLNVGNVTTFAVTNVPPGPIYYRVRRNTSCGVSANSNTIQYQTLQAKTPVATAAAVLACDSFTANWGAVDGANTYYLDVSTNAGFTAILPAYNGLNVGNVTSRVVTGLTSGTTYYYRVRSGNTCGMMPTSSNTIAILINVGPTAPVVGTITQATCAKPLGTVVLSGLPAGEWTLQLLSGGTYSGRGTSVTIPDLAPGVTYNVAVKTDACLSPYSSNIAIAPLIVTTSTWNGSWSPSPPTINNYAVFANNYISSGNLSACKCTVNSGISVTVRSGDTFTITNEVTTTGGTLTFENSASLVQTNDVGNTGDIVYKRISQPMQNYDFTYWSSPVNGQVFNVLSPNTRFDKYLSFNSTINYWQEELPSASMTLGKGYIIRAPLAGSLDNGVNVVFPYAQPVQFVGIPNNGNVFGEEITALTATRYFLIGNPYPSALDASLFLSANATILEGTIYLWTHNTPIGPKGASYGYSPNDYASYNLTGGVGTSAKSSPGHNDDPSLDLGKKPSGKIAAGQSFFAASKAAGTIAFTNTMRVQGNNNQFFKPGKTSELEKHRLWLEFSNDGGAYKQTLVGYIEGASNNYEDQFDGISFDGNPFVDFYSINNDKKLVIQGRALPFDNTDAVPLGYKTTIAGTFTIGINQTDGTLSNQPIYLEDRLSQTTHDLRMANYTFTTAIGTFDDRFVLKYSNTNLGSDDFENKNNLLVTVNHKVITINSIEGDAISKIFIYDVSGKLIYKKDKINSNQFSAQLNVAEQVLLLKIVLESGIDETRKIIFR